MYRGALSVSRPGGMLAWLSGHLLELKVQGCGAGAVSRSEPKPGRSHVQSRFVECLCIPLLRGQLGQPPRLDCRSPRLHRGLVFIWGGGGAGGTGTSGPETWFRHFDFQNSGRLTKSELRGAQPSICYICSSSAALSIFRFEAPGRGEGADRGQVPQSFCHGSGRPSTARNWRPRGRPRGGRGAPGRRTSESGERQDEHRRRTLFARAEVLKLRDLVEAARRPRRGALRAPSLPPSAFV